MEGTLRVAGTIGESIVDGPGLRYVIFTQGCPHHCPGCHNRHTHSFEEGMLIKLETLYQDIIRNPMLSGVTFSGGEPFCQPAMLTRLAVALREQGKHIMVYSGYTFEQLQAMGEDERALLEQTDMLVDGPYMEGLRDLTLRFRGSRNQRVLDAQASLRAGEPIWVPEYLQKPTHTL